MTPRTESVFQNNDRWHIKQLFIIFLVCLLFLSSKSTLTNFCRGGKKTASRKIRPGYYFFSGPTHMYSRNWTLERWNGLSFTHKPEISSEREHIWQDQTISMAKPPFLSLVEESRPHLWVSKLYHSENPQRKKCLGKKVSSCQSTL